MAANKHRQVPGELTAGTRCVAFPRSESIRTQSQRESLQLAENMWQGNGGQLRKGRCLKHRQPWGRQVSPGHPPHLSVRCSSLKMCTVSVLLEAHRNWESMLNTRELMFTYLGPRRRDWSPLGTLPNGIC